MRLILLTLCSLFNLLQVAVSQDAPPARMTSGQFEAAMEEARHLARSGHIDQASARCGELRRQLDTLRQRAEYASLLTLEGTIARAGGEVQRAIAFHQRALSIRLSVFGNHSGEVSSSYLNLGNCLLEADQPIVAAPYLQQGISIKTQLYGENDPRLINNLNSLGTCYEKAGDFRRARDAFAKALRLGEQIQEEKGPALIPLLTNLSSLYLSQNMPDSALHLLRQAQQIQTDSVGEIHPATALIYDKMGFVLLQKGMPRAALPYFQKALAIYARLPVEYGIAHASCLQNTGNCLLEQGDSRSAIPYFNRANSLLQEVPAKQAGNLNSLGLTYLYMGLPDEAAEAFNNALGILYANDATTANQPLVAGTLQNLGSCLMARQEYATALKIFQKADSYLGPELATSELAFNIRNKIAESQTRLGQLTAAATSLERAKTTLRRLTPSQRFTYHFAKGNLFFKTTDYQRAATAYEEALHVLQSPNGEENLYPYETIQARAALATTYARHNFPGHWEKALAASTISIAELEKLKGQLTNFSSGNILQDIFHEPYLIAIEACLQLQRPAQAFEFSERYRGSFLRQLAFRTGTAAPDSSALERVSLEKQIAALKKERFLRSSSPFSEKSIQDIGRLDSSILALSLRLQQTAPVSPQGRKDYLTLSEIQRYLGPDESLLQYHWGEGEVVLFLVQQNHLQTFSIPDPDLKEKISELYQLSSLPYDLLNTAAARQNFQRWTTLSHQLYQALLEPVRAAVAGHRLLVVPDGPICYLPFGLLLQAMPAQPSFFRTHPYLVRDFDIRYLHAASLLAARQGPSAAKPRHRLLALAPFFEANSLGLQPLKNNIEETETILGKMGGLALKGHKATEANYLQAMGQSQIIHFSTHGILNDRAPEFSYLAFSEIPDGIENEQLFISEINHQPTAADLIVLSACQTASGKLHQGEGMASIAQAFLYAGARCLVASLWNVDDQKTPTLMGHFYDGLRDGLDKSSALRRAQLAYLEKTDHKKAHPYYWAGFIHFGDSTPLTTNHTKEEPGQWPGWWWCIPAGALLVFQARKKRWFIPRNKQS